MLTLKSGSSVSVPECWDHSLTYPTGNKLGDDYYYCCCAGWGTLWHLQKLLQCIKCIYLSSPVHHFPLSPSPHPLYACVHSICIVFIKLGELDHLVAFLRVVLRQPAFMHPGAPPSSLPTVRVTTSICSMTLKGSVMGKLFMSQTWK
jgi:hypothetical protein